MGGWRRFGWTLGMAVGIAAGLWLLYAATERYKNVGSMGEWISGIGALLAILVATATFRRQREFDLAHRAEDATAASGAALRTDLDETRRLVYMALISYDTDVPISVEARASLANALAHHSGRLGATDAVDLVNELWEKTANNREPPPRTLRRDLQNLVRDLSDELGEDWTRWDLPRGGSRPVAHPDDDE